MSRILLLVTLLLAVPASFAQAQSNSPLRTSYTHQLDSDIDGGGNLSSASFNAGLGYPILNEPGRLVALTARYKWTRFDFSGNPPASFGALDPWNEIHSLKFSLPIFLEAQHRLDSLRPAQCKFVPRKRS